MHYFTPFYSPFTPGLTFAFLPLLIIVLLWTVILKGYALWHSARNSQKWWFIVLLIVNTVGILEIIYLIWFRSDTHTHHSHTSHTPAHHSSEQA
jgi:Family of unknown function (DUF5652)